MSDNTKKQEPLFFPMSSDEQRKAGWTHAVTFLSDISEFVEKTDGYGMELEQLDLALTFLDNHLRRGTGLAQLIEKRVVDELNFLKVEKQIAQQQQKESRQRRESERDSFALGFIDYLEKHTDLDIRRTPEPWRYEPLLERYKKSLKP